MLMALVSPLSSILMKAHAFVKEEGVTLGSNLDQHNFAIGYLFGAIHKASQTANREEGEPSSPHDLPFIKPKWSRFQKTLLNCDIEYIFRVGVLGGRIQE